MSCGGVCGELDKKLSVIGRRLLLRESVGGEVFKVQHLPPNLNHLHLNERNLRTGLHDGRFETLVRASCPPLSAGFAAFLCFVDFSVTVGRQGCGGRNWLVRNLILIRIKKIIVITENMQALY